MDFFRNYPEQEKQFRQNKKQYFATTEIAYILRYLKGDETIKSDYFSESNLYLVKNLQIMKMFYIYFKKPRGMQELAKELFNGDYWEANNFQNWAMSNNYLKLNNAHCFVNNINK